MWPLIRVLGVPFSYEAICDECTRAKYKLDPDVEIAVWVRINDAPKKAAKLVKKKAATKRAPKVKCSICYQSGHLYSACPMTTEPLL
jgi:hypothetical protein